MNATHRISKARTTLLLDHPFFGALLYRLKPVPNNRQPTMATDGVSLFYNDNFVEDLAPAELVGVLAHEVMHPALKHHVRRGDRNPRVWNIACDYAINPLLVDAGLHLPKGILLDNSYRGMSAEAIYNRIAQEQEESGGDPKDGSAGQGKDGGQGQKPDQTPGQRPVETPGGFGQVMDAPNPEEPGQTATPAQISQQEQQWSEATTQAAAISRMAGKVPLGADRAIEGAAEAKVDWREHLRRTFSEAAFPADYSWSRPNRRFAHAGLFLPSVQKEGVGELVVAVDCSGSISDRILGVFQAEVQALVDEHRPSQVHVLYFDEVINRHDTFCGGEAITLEPAGGGGTNFVPIFEHIAEQALAPTTTIVLTDLYGPMPDDEPPYPVIWACTTRNTAPFGETVHMDIA